MVSEVCEVSERGESPERKKVKTTDDLSDKIVAQLEYYFSDANLIRDKFMKEEFAKNDGWITIETMLKFAKLKALAQDEKTIVDAIKGSNSDLIKLDEESTKIKRTVPMPNEEVEKEILSRTLHLSGFPLDYTFENLTRWCNQYGETESISMRHFYKVKKFKGCIHVIYKTKEDADKIMKEGALKCKDREIRKENMEMYHKRKAEIKEKRMQKSNKKK